MVFGHGVARALVDVHAHGLVHGYLSSHNVFFSPASKVQVGVPGTSATDDALLEWTAPEVLAGDAPPSFASDIYAFGILMTEFDTFKQPYEDDAFDDEVALTIAVVDGGYRPALRDNCEGWLQDLVDRCVDADPNLRPTAVELAASGTRPRSRGTGRRATARSQSASFHIRPDCSICIFGRRCKLGI
ncbi:hypothetical protein SPRG_22321 [Saprolegnia parasitica CBS 223.65]|uniref:Protein kinase domain-containing protein n=1 Tax=Saprolegnia parasitica (strain CBS 223.65) TaxID=695850 RepID=A0A067C521_SAPPC|nr:hypothetical protein SPRG_22321 [Saprolegnia parasitica CBS 223.65]KDO21917.1 hypothetical protein SPRG_22321 [Saprolegnia parasitica CBS 223.65]|eukprot:XP_012207393.1 hypothetical protein SPRG_22321 [Saprolegnia parasitica CBS 223.65]